MRREPGRGEPADRHGRRPRDGARREDQHRGQRALPPRRTSSPGATGRRKTRSSAKPRKRTSMMLARRRHRLHGERRGPRDGDDGPDQVARGCEGDFLDVGGARRGTCDESVQADWKNRRQSNLVNIFVASSPRHDPRGRDRRGPRPGPGPAGRGAHRGTNAVRAEAAPGERPGPDRGRGLYRRREQVVAVARYKVSGARLRRLGSSSDHLRISPTAPRKQEDPRPCEALTGKQGTFDLEQCIDDCTRLVAGVTPGRGGEAPGPPVLETVRAAVAGRGQCDAHPVPAAFRC